MLLCPFTYFCLNLSPSVTVSSCPIIHGVSRPKIETCSNRCLHCASLPTHDSTFSTGQEGKGDWWRSIWEGGGGGGKGGGGVGELRRGVGESLNWYIRGLNRNASYKWELMNSLLSVWILTTIYTLLPWSVEQHDLARGGGSRGSVGREGRDCGSALRPDVGWGRNTESENQWGVCPS